MNIPPWLASMTGAAPFATNPNNAFQPTMGDAMQGIGHSMAEHYRRGQQGPNTPAPLAGAPQPEMPPPGPMQQLQAPPPIPQSPPIGQVSFSPSQGNFPQGLTLAQLLQQIR